MYLEQVRDGSCDLWAAPAVLPRPGRPEPPKNRLSLLADTDFFPGPKLFFNALLRNILPRDVSLAITGKGCTVYLLGIRRQLLGSFPFMMRPCD